MAGSSRVAPVIALVVLAVTACVPTPRIIVPHAGGDNADHLAALLANHPLAPDQNISATPLGKTEALSYHLVQIRDRERPHIHATHDLVVTLVRGSGHLYVRGEAREMGPGDVAVVVHGTPHYFVNTGGSPTVAFVTFAPPYDGTDQVPIAASP